MLFCLLSQARRGTEVVVSAATLRFSQFQFAAATSGGVYLIDSRRPGRAVCAWELGGTEPPAFLAAAAGGSASLGSAGDVIHNLTTCSINLGETVGYAARVYSLCLFVHVGLQCAACFVNTHFS